MRINKLTASFGKLSNQTLELHDGLNVISAPNESGKSTWCAFIRAMLYGIDSSERASKGYLPDKQRYLPWSGAAMQGSMELTRNGRDITVTRTSSRAGLMKEFSAVYTGTATPVDGLNGTNAGEVLTGISKDVFNRSAFVGQGAVAFSGSPELEKRIASIVSTGEETGSYTEADERLRAWGRKRRHNRIGMLPETEARLEQLSGRMESAAGLTAEISEVENALAAEKENILRIESELKDAKLRQQKEGYEKLTAALSAMEQEHEAKKERLALLGQELTNAEAERISGARDRLIEECAALESDCAAKKARIASLEEEVNLMRKTQRRDALEKLNLSRAELKACIKEREEAADALIRAREALSKSPYAGADRDSTVKTILADADAVDRLGAVADGKSVVSIVPTVIASVLFAAAVIALALTGVLVLAACAAVFLGAGIFLLIKYSKAKKTKSAAEEKKRNILAGYRADNSDALRKIADDFAALCDGVTDAEKRDAMAKAAYDQRHTRHELIEQSALDEVNFTDGSSEGARLSRELEGAKEAYRTAADALAAAKGRLAAMEDGAFAPAGVPGSNGRLDAARAEVQESAEKVSSLRGRIDAIGYPCPVTAEPDAASASPAVAQLSRELIEARESVQALAAKAAGIRGRLAAVGDPLILASDMEYLKAKKASLEKEYDAITLAVGTLRQADAEMQSRFSPALGRAAAEFMGAATGGRYDEVLVNRDFSVLTHASDDTVAHDSAYLSAGTLDLMYLSVRLAVCKLALPEGESCPLIIDDALANLDDERYEQVITMLGELAKTRQVILFTCRRE